VRLSLAQEGGNFVGEFRMMAVVRSQSIEIDGEGGRTGLLSMRERVEQLGGQLEVVPNPDGTLIRVRLPLEENCA